MCTAIRTKRSALGLMERHGIIPAMQTQTLILDEMTKYFIERGFKWMLPVMLSFVTDPLWPEPASRHLAPPKVRIYGREMNLMHSMILHKQLSTGMGLDRIFVISPNVRLESSERDDGVHAYEFSQFDFEVAGAKMADAMALIEGAVAAALNRARSSELLAASGRYLPEMRPPFETYTAGEVAELFGSERGASLASSQPFWVTDISREFYDREDPERPGHYRNYDLVLPEGYGEVCSGGEREHDFATINRKLKSGGLKPAAFAPYLEIARAGMLRPSAGAGIGIERLVRYAVGARHIADVQPFPRVPGIPALV